MDIDLFGNRGPPLGEQRFTWRDLVQQPYSKLDDDAFTRVRVIFMNGIESDAVPRGDRAPGEGVRLAGERRAGRGDVRTMPWR